MSRYATRPKTFADLDHWDNRPEPFLELNPKNLTHDTAVGAAALTLIEACRSSSKFDVEEDDRFIVTRPKTEKEQEWALKQAQDSYDRGTEWLQMVRDGEPIPHYAVWKVQETAKARGVTDLPEIIVEEEEQ